MFDRSVITEGRFIQEFGLCDLKGVYQNTAKLRTKGWLVIAFFDQSDPYSISVIKTLQQWASSLPGDKVTIIGILLGERVGIDKFVEANGLTFPILWDFDSNTASLFGLNSIPAVFITDARGMTTERIIGDDSAALATAKTKLEAAIQAAAEAAAAAKVAEEAAKAASPAAPAPPPAPVAAAPAISNPAPTPANSAEATPASPVSLGPPATTAEEPAVVLGKEKDKKNGKSKK